MNSRRKLRRLEGEIRRTVKEFDAFAPARRIILKNVKAVCRGRTMKIRFSVMGIMEDGSELTPVNVKRNAVQVKVSLHSAPTIVSAIEMPHPSVANMFLSATETAMALVARWESMVLDLREQGLL